MGRLSAACGVNSNRAAAACCGRPPRRCRALVCRAGFACDRGSAAVRGGKNRCLQAHAGDTSAARMSDNHPNRVGVRAEVSSASAAIRLLWRVVAIPVLPPLHSRNARAACVLGRSAHVLRGRRYQRFLPSITTTGASAATKSSSKRALTPMRRVRWSQLASGSNAGLSVNVPQPHIGQK